MPIATSSPTRMPRHASCSSSTRFLRSASPRPVSSTPLTVRSNSPDSPWTARSVLRSSSVSSYHRPFEYGGLLLRRFSTTAIALLSAAVPFGRGASAIEANGAVVLRLGLGPFADPPRIRPNFGEAGVGTTATGFYTLTGAVSSPLNLLSALTRSAASSTSAEATSASVGVSSYQQTASGSAPSPKSTSIYDRLSSSPARRRRRWRSSCCCPPPFDQSYPSLRSSFFCPALCTASQSSVPPSRPHNPP